MLRLSLTFFLSTTDKKSSNFQCIYLQTTNMKKLLQPESWIKFQRCITWDTLWPTAGRYQSLHYCPLHYFTIFSTSRPFYFANLINLCRPLGQPSHTSQSLPPLKKPSLFSNFFNFCHCAISYLPLHHFYTIALVFALSLVDSSFKPY